MKSLRKTTLSAFISTAVLCMAFWLLITWSVAPEELIAGALVSVAVSLFSARFFIHENAFWFLNPAKFFVGVFYCAIIFPWELLKANWDMAKRALSPKMKINPGIVRVPVSLQSDYGQALLADSITLTPGTITMNVEDTTTPGGDRAYFFIHWIDVTELNRVKAGEIIKGTMEKWVRRIYK